MNNSKHSSLKISIAFVIAMLLLFTLSVNAHGNQNSLLLLQQKWAKVNYQLTGKEQDEAFKALLNKAKIIVEDNDKDADTWIWLGIIQSSYAGAKGGLGALSLAEAAKVSLENALVLNDKALSGSAYSSLGTLYSKVPGWPIGFGDDKQAKIYLEKAVKLNPNGIDPNYFIAEMLYDQRKYQAAKNYLQQAFNAKPRENRPLADKSRQQEVALLMNKVNNKLNQAFR